MIFRSFYNLQSNKNPDELRAHLLGQHLKVHELDFEIFQKEEYVKIIPNADEKHIYTLPITRLKFTSTANGTKINVMSKPRRIDVGGPYLLLIFILFAFIASVLLFIYGGEAYTITSYILAGMAVLVFLFLFIRLQQGYYDYIRKIKTWLKSHV